MVYPELVAGGGIGTTPQSGSLRLLSEHNNMNLYAEISFEFGDSNVAGYISGSNYSNPGAYSYLGTGIRNFGTISRWSLFDIGDANSVASTDPTTGATTRVYDVPYSFITTWNDSNPDTINAFAQGPPIPPALDNKVCSESGAFQVIEGCFVQELVGYDVTTDINYAPNANYHNGDYCLGPHVGCNLDITNVDPVDYISNPPNANQVNNFQYFMSYDPNSTLTSSTSQIQVDAVNANQCKICKPPTINNTYIGTQGSSGYDRWFIEIEVIVLMIM